MELQRENLTKVNRKRNSNLSEVRKKLVVMSSKSGVGKSTISANLANFLSIEGYTVGLLDSNRCNSSIPKIMGLNCKKSELETVKYDDDLEVISTGFFEDSEIDKSAMVQSFFQDVNWGNKDYLVIDSPSGTSDENLETLKSIDKIYGIVFVTTPEAGSVSDFTKALNFSRKLNTPIIGIIENMSGKIPLDADLQSGEDLSKIFDVPFWGKISKDSMIARHCNEGRLIVEHAKGSDNRDEMLYAFRKVLKVPTLYN